GDDSVSGRLTRRSGDRARALAILSVPDVRGRPARAQPGRLAAVRGDGRTAARDPAGGDGVHSTVHPVAPGGRAAGVEAPRRPGLDPRGAGGLSAALRKPAPGWRSPRPT